MPPTSGTNLTRLIAPAAIAVAGATSVLLAMGSGGEGSTGLREQQFERPRVVRLLAHASFEDNAAAWRGVGAVSRRTSALDMPHGRFALRTVRAARDRGEIRARGPQFRAARGSFHRASVRVRAANRSSLGMSVRLVLVVHDAAGIRRVHSSSPLILTNRFRYLDAASGPVQGQRVSMEVVATGVAQGRGFELDAATLTHSTTRSPTLSATLQEQNDRAQQRPYDPNAFINRPIPVDASLHPRSAAIVADLKANVATKGVAASVDGEVPPVYVAGPDDRFYRVELNGRTERFRVPASAMPGTGEDHPLVILDPRHPEHGPMVELRVWRAAVDHQARRITGEGVGLFHYNNDGERLNPDGSPSVSVPFLGRGTGSGLSYTAGLVRPASFPGEIEHAIRVSWGCNDFDNGFRAPAVQSDQRAGTCGSTTPVEARVRMGMRLRLDPAVNCEARTAPSLPGRPALVTETAFIRTVCRALQDYGMVILDGTAQDGLLIYMENESTAGWSALIGPSRFGSYGYLLRDQTTPTDGLGRSSSSGIPWSRMQVIN